MSKSKKFRRSAGPVERAATAPEALASHPAQDHAAAVAPEVRAPTAVVDHAAARSPDSDVRGVLIQLVGSRLLLPNATIAEVMSYAPPEPVADAPDWLLGRIRWRGWQLPLIAFARLAALAEEKGGLGSKVVVLKALGGDAKSPYFAILTQGFPRLVTVSRDGLIIDADADDLPLGVQARVTLNQDDAFVPDLDAVERLISEALAVAA